MKIIESILTKNPCYTAGKKIAIKGLMLHSVGCPQPSASVFIKNWNKETYGRACVHGFIDANDFNCYQTLPWNHRGWHAGGSANNTHIGVEMCEPACIKYTGGSTFTCSDLKTAQEVVKKLYYAAVELFGYLCQCYGLDPSKKGVIVSHKEGHALGISSNHGDPEHLWKGLGLPFTMDTFRADVIHIMGGSKTPAPAPTPAPSPATSYRVKITASVLNVRKGPGTSYGIATTVKKGDVYTIVDEKKNGSTRWGKLKSGAGWISLGYTKRI